VAAIITLNDVGSMMADPWSSEYPIDAAATEPHVVALATSAKGEVTCVPFTGVVTVIADAGIVLATSARAAKRIFFIKCLD
jgi:hypothetical protein